MTEWFEYDIVELHKPTLIHLWYVSSLDSKFLRRPTKEELGDDDRHSLTVIEPGRYQVWINKKSEVFYIKRIEDCDIGKYKKIMRYDQTQKTYHLILPKNESFNYKIVKNLTGKIMVRLSRDNFLGTLLHIYLTDLSDWTYCSLVYGMGD